MLIGGSIGHVI